MADFSKAETLMAEAIDRGVFPGAVLLVSAGNEVAWLRAYGHASLVPSKTIMTETALFDLASLTKPLATTVAIMTLAARGTISVDQTLGDVLPLDSGSPMKHIRLRHLLSHSSGLPAYRPYFRRLRFRPLLDRRRLLGKWIQEELLLAEPGTAACYSDLGFMLLGWAVEHVTGQRLDRFVADAIYQPLGLALTGFRPLDDGTLPPVSVIVSTEECPWRKKVLSGEVHDDNAYVLGGVSGHAGLFGTAGDLHVLLGALLQAWHGKGETSALPRDLVRSFLMRQDASFGTTWALGFDTPSATGSSAGRFFSEGSVGHLGFTGVSFWMDLEKEILVILLTNRVHPSRKNDAIRSFRPAIHDAVMAALLGLGII